MRKRNLTAAIALTLFCSTAIAGLALVTPVAVTFNDDGSGIATGGMAAARFADNEIDYIGCGTRNIAAPDGSFVEFAFCQAGDSSETEAFCSTLNSDLVRAVRSISDYSFLRFTWDVAGECNSIGISGNSFHLFSGKDSKK